MAEDASNDTFTCARCRRTFPRDHDHDAIAEYERNFSVPFDPENVAVLCDDCFTVFDRNMENSNLKKEDGTYEVPEDIESITKRWPY